jgi:hypothetical protein
MSNVTDIALILPLNSDEVVREINQWIDAQDDVYGLFKKVDEYGGGRKAHQWDMWTGAFNHFPIDDFLTAFANIPTQRWGWGGDEDRAKARIIVQKEEVEQFAVLSVGDPFPWGYP